MNSALDWKFYLDFYPDLRLNNITTEHAVVSHYKRYGIRENRVPNRQLLEERLATIENEIKTEADSYEHKSSHPYNLINILIRTSRRPQFFNECIQSVLGQEYTNYRVLISYDTDDTLEYILPYQAYGVEAFDMRHLPRTDYGFNLYCNELMRQVSDGFVLFLDDDDRFAHSHALQMIDQAIKGKKGDPQNHVVVWKFFRPDKTIWPRHVPQITYGEIDTTCVCFHSSHSRRAMWRAQRGGDFAFFSDLFSRFKFTYTVLSSILTRTSFDNKMAGLGDAKDKT